MYKKFIFIITLVIIFYFQADCQSINMEKEIFQPLSYQLADKKADSVIKLMTKDEIISLVSGDKSFFIRSIPRLNINEMYMADATQGVHIRDKFRDVDLSKYQPEKSTAFPCPISLAASWNPELAFRYAEAIGEECRAGNIGILLGPGVNQVQAISVRQKF